MGFRNNPRPQLGAFGKASQPSCVERGASAYLRSPASARGWLTRWAVVEKNKKYSLNVYSGGLSLPVGIPARRRVTVCPKG